MTKDRRDENELERALKELGNDPAVDNFLSGYGNVRTKVLYADALKLYWRWLNAGGS
jgi:hypothetical protein